MIYLCLALYCLGTVTMFWVVDEHIGAAWRKALVIAGWPVAVLVSLVAAATPRQTGG